MKKILTLLFFACLMCCVVGLSACGDTGKESTSINEYYCFIDGNQTKVSIEDVITLPTEVDNLAFDEKLLGWENTYTQQRYEVGESVTLNESMFYPAGDHLEYDGEYEVAYHRYEAVFSPIVEAIERTVYFHYFEDMTLEWESTAEISSLTARNVISPYCLDNADPSIQWKTGNRLDWGWLFLDKYNFEGWYLDEEYTKEFWDFSDIDMSDLGDELHLYAKWTYTGIVYEEYDAASWRVVEIDLRNDIEQIVIPSEYGRGKNCDIENAGYRIIGISENAFKGTGTIGTLVLQSGIELSYENFAGANISCISLDNVSIPTYYGNSYTKVFDGYTGLLTCSETSGYEFVDGILYDKNTNEILWVSAHIPAEITLREGVTSIYTLFSGTNIEKITLPTTVESIESNAFQNCVNLKSIILEGSVDYVSPNAFDGCTSLEYEVYGGAKYIGNTLMGIQDGATLLEIKDGCKSIPSSFMQGNETVKKVILPASVTSIENEAFKNSAIEEIVISGEDFYFGSYAFEGCCNLRTVTMPETTQYIGACCFKECASLESIDLSGLVKAYSDSVALDWGAFLGCTALENVIMSESITKLYAQTFTDCVNLKEIFLPKNIIEVEEGCFSCCTSLKTISMPGVNRLGDNFFVGCTSLASVSIPAVTSLGTSCFNGCISLVAIELSQGVTALPENCFANCTSLTSISMPSVTSLGASCFEGCTALSALVLPDTIVIIDMDCFNNCSNLEYVFYHGNYKQWDYVDNKCSDIESKVYFYSAEVQTIENYIETRKACWGYDQNNIPTAWVVPTKLLEGKTFAMSDVSVVVSDYYWNLVVLAKESGQLENAFGADPALYNAANTATTKQEFAENLEQYYLNKFSSQISFENGVMTTSQNDTVVSTFSYIEINGEIVYVPQTKRTLNILSVSQISETEEGEKISGNDTLTVTYHYSLV